MKMIAVLLLSLLLTSIASATCVEPKIMGSIPNKADGKIMFLSTDENCPEPNPGRDVIGVNANGRALKGCWVAKGAELVVEWNGGDTYVYPIANVTLTKEAEAEIACKNRAT